MAEFRSVAIVESEFPEQSFAVFDDSDGQPVKVAIIGGVGRSRCGCDREYGDNGRG